MKTIGVVGGGVLGKAVARGFMEHAEIRVFDIDPKRSTHSVGEVAASDIVFVCLPTPAKSDGRCDTSAIDGFLKNVVYYGWWQASSCYVIRSTVPVGYTNNLANQSKLPILHSPEFLTARCANVDFQTPARNIIGRPSLTLWPKSAETLAALYESRFPGVPTLVMGSDESELVKLACNTFFGAKVTLFNLFADLCTSRGMDWDAVRQGIMTDGRIAHAHTTVPGPDGQRGFGGTCLPKDTADLYHCCQAAGVDAELLRAVLARNTASRPGDPAVSKICLP